jgi:hypothetical protein
MKKNGVWVYVPKVTCSKTIGDGTYDVYSPLCGGAGSIDPEYEINY